MTACSNKRGKAGRVITAALVGALSVGAPAVALATGGIDMMALQDDEAAWQQSTVKYTVDAVEGTYTTKVGTIFAVAQVTDMLGNVVPTSDYTVAYFDASGNIVQASAAINNKDGGAPDAAGTYTLVIYKGDVALASDDTLSGSHTTTPAIKTGFTIEGEKDGLEGAFAYEVGTDPDDLTDTSFAYTGDSFKVNFGVGSDAVAQGGYDIVWTQYAGASAPAWSTDGYVVTDAGTYTARITAKDGGAYSGSATVSFEVKGIDLSAADVVFAPRDTTDGIDFSSSSDKDGYEGVLRNSKLTVDGAEIDDDAEFTATLIAVDDAGVTASSYKTKVTAPGKYTFKLVANDDQKNVSGSCLVDAYIVNHKVTYKYAGSACPSTFDPAYGQAFNPSYITADAITINGQTVKPEFTVVVKNAKGEVVTDYSAAGSYTVTIDTKVTTYGGNTYAGHEEWTFTVAGKSYATAEAYVFVDDKVASNSTELEYTGEEYPVQVVVKMGGDTLKEGTDYEVALTDNEGEAVDSVLGIGSYTVTVTGKDAAETEIGTVTFKVGKAVIKSAEPTADFFALPADGSAASPSFVGSTDAEFSKGQKFDLAADEIDVTYYTGSWNDADNDGVVDSGEMTYTKVKASELTKEGTYYADITVLTTAENIKTTTSVSKVKFTLLKSAAFEDVDAGAWYADVVYKASDLNYMKGVGGTKLFMPEAKISRAEMACTMFNLAGQTGSAGVENWPTRFEDVVSNTWYSQAVSWASEAGVMNGNGNVFGINDYTNREQVAAIFYNYAKAQGKDVSVKDADAALAAYADGSQVSDWAKVAVAWAVENGVMGNGELLAPQSTITRAEMAAMAVNFQPEALK